MKKQENGVYRSLLAASRQAVETAALSGGTGFFSPSGLSSRKRAEEQESRGMEAVARMLCRARHG